jgi:hypothetical protein
MVNPIFEYHFDRGIVGSPNDFGRLASAQHTPNCWITWPTNSSLAGTA